MLWPTTVILVALVVSIPNAFAQSTSPGTSVAPPSMRQQPAPPRGGRPPAAQAGGNVSNLSADECRRLGGKLQDDVKCKNAQRCVVTLANQDVRSICIDELKHE